MNLDLSDYRARLASASPERAWKSLRELALRGQGEALALAAEFAEIAEPSSEKLLKLWPQALDPDAGPAWR